MNYYGKAITECLTVPLTLKEMADITGFQLRFVIEGIRSAREDGYRITARSGVMTDEGRSPTEYTLEDRNDS